MIVELLLILLLYCFIMLILLVFTQLLYGTSPFVSVQEHCSSEILLYVLQLPLLKGPALNSGPRFHTYETKLVSYH